MSAKFPIHRLRLGIVRELAEALLKFSHSEIADKIGVAQTTVSRRGDDLRMWPADDLFVVADMHEDLGDAIIARLSPAEAIPNSKEIVQELCDCLGLAGGMVSEASAALVDGRIDQREAAQLCDSTRAMIEKLNLLHATLRVAKEGI